jgi:NAD(P)-dependent dehydrogenase (short-subunit alcohol dehydrogenase family)
MMNEVFRDGPLDGLINNAAGNILAESETLSPRAADAVVNIVLKRSANGRLAAGRCWLDLGRPGRVLSVTTTYAWTGSAFVLPSAMAKAGVLAMTQSLAVEWGDRGIRLDAIAPGLFPTKGAWECLLPTPEITEDFEKLNPLGRARKHRELTNLVAFLMADGSAYVNGDVVTIGSRPVQLPSGTHDRLPLGRNAGGAATALTRTVVALCAGMRPGLTRPCRSLVGGAHNCEAGLAKSVAWNHMRV